MAGSTVWEHPFPPSVQGKTLLDRVGGVKAIETFIDGFYNRLLHDKEVAPYLLKSQMAQRQEVYMQLLKDRSVEYLEVIWGGDAYEGQDMFKAHAHLHISAKAYDKSTKCALAQVKAMKLSSEVAKAVMDEMEVLREPITDADGKFHRWVHEKQKELEDVALGEGAVDLTGMGFTTSPAAAKKMKDDARKKLELKERLAAFKQAKKEEAKRAAKEEQIQIEKDAKAKIKEQKPKEKAAQSESASPKTKGSSKTIEKQKSKSTSATQDKENPANSGDAEVASKRQSQMEEVLLPELPTYEDETAFVPESSMPRQVSWRADC